MRRLKLPLLSLAVALLGFTGVASASATATLFGATGSGSGPSGLAIDRSGNLFTANSSNSTISKITPAGVVTAAWATTSEPRTIATGPSGDVYVGGDTGADQTKVRTFTAAGTGPTEYATDGGQNVFRVAVDASNNIFYASGGDLGTIRSGGTDRYSRDLFFGIGAVAVDGLGKVWVVRSGGGDKVYRYDGDRNLSNGRDFTVGLTPREIAFDSQYAYVVYSGSGSGSDGGVSRISLADGTVTQAWATGFPTNQPQIAVGPDGRIYVSGQRPGPTGNPVTAITPAGTSTTLATVSFVPRGLVVDSLNNVYLLSSGMGGPSDVAGVYKIAQAAPTPTPTPAPTPTPTPTPEPGPAVKTNTIPSEIRIASEATPEVKVPCEAADGELLTECTVQITAPRSVLAGLGSGIEVTNARAAKTVTLGKATITPKTPRKRIVVTVRFNKNGKRALSRNIRVSGLIDLTAVTQASTESSGSKRVRLQLPRQTMTPTKGIFDTLSTSLNKDGVAFVNRLAKVLPKKPKRIVCTGFADGSGVPGDNVWLGEQRAKTLCNELAKRGIKPRSTRLVSRGADDPRASDKTPDGRAKNRRASITITY